MTVWRVLVVAVALSTSSTALACANHMEGDKKKVAETGDPQPRSAEPAVATHKDPAPAQAEAAPTASAEPAAAKVEASTETPSSGMGCSVSNGAGVGGLGWLAVAGLMGIRRRSFAAASR